MVESNDVQAEVVYYEATDGRAVVYQGEPGQESRRVGTFDPRSVDIHNGRELGALDLDEHGFEFHELHGDWLNFYDDAEIERVYYPQVEQLLREKAGATRVHIFDHTVRIEDAAKRENALSRAPVRMAHNDYTVGSGPKRVADLIDPGEQADWLDGRFGIINVWRSIRGTVHTMPIAIVDARSVGIDDFVLTDLVYPDRVGEIYYLAHNPAHQWYYFPQMTPAEVLLIKSFDSALDGTARFTPHTAFVNPAAPADVPGRESIEVRALVQLPDRTRATH